VSGFRGRDRPPAPSPPLFIELEIGIEIEIGTFVPHGIFAHVEPISISIAISISISIAIAIAISISISILSNDTTFACENDSGIRHYRNVTSFGPVLPARLQWRVTMTIAIRVFAACALSLAFIAVGLPARAQPSDACKGDIEKLCADVKKGQGRLIKCLNEHSAEVSADCKKAMAERKAARARHAARRAQGRKGGGMRPACNADIEKLCKSAVGKRRELATCLNEHKSDLTSECKESVERVMKQIQERAAGKEKS
jgi:hypothetical protein